MVIAGLRRGDGEWLARIVRQKQGVGGAGGLAALIANGRSTVFSGCIAAVKLHGR